MRIDQDIASTQTSGVLLLRLHVCCCRCCCTFSSLGREIRRSVHVELHIASKANKRLVGLRECLLNYLHTFAVASPKYNVFSEHTCRSGAMVLQKINQIFAKQNRMNESRNGISLLHIKHKRCHSLPTLIRKHAHLPTFSNFSLPCAVEPDAS